VSPLMNIGASVHQRLKNVSKDSGRSFNDLVQYYALERWLYRLSQSGHENLFILKGALMLVAWRAPILRATRDIDLLARTSNDLDGIKHIISEICRTDLPDDGVWFDPDSVTTTRIAEDADYNRETVIAEKFDAMVSLGRLNSRMKDFFDVWLLASTSDFSGADLSAAILATFRKRGTELTAVPQAFEDDFLFDPSKQSQWTGFLKRMRPSEAPSTFSDAVTSIRAFLQPVHEALCSGDSFTMTWKHPGPWRQ